MVIFFFNDTATPDIYTLSLHAVLPISRTGWAGRTPADRTGPACRTRQACPGPTPPPPPGLPTSPPPDQEPFGSDRKSTRLNSSHANISYAVFCLKKKKTNVH